MSNFDHFVSILERNIHREIPTIGGRAAFIIERYSDGFIIIPSATNVPRYISLESLREFTREYSFSKSWAPSTYAAHSRNASYILALIKMYEDECGHLEVHFDSDSVKTSYGLMQAHFVSEISFPVWSIVHYLTSLSETYFKLLIIQRLCDALVEGYNLEDFLVFERPAELISTNPFVFDSGGASRTLGSEQSEYERFWSAVKNNNRPMVFVRDKGAYRSLIDIKKDDLIINKLVVSSPPDITVSGVGQALSDIYYAPEREERSRQEHEARQINQFVKNIGDIAETQQKINQAKIGDGHREYLNSLLEDALAKQAQLQRQMGIQHRGIRGKA